MDLSTVGDPLEPTNVAGNSLESTNAAEDLLETTKADFCEKVRLLCCGNSYVQLQEIDPLVVENVYVRQPSPQPQASQEVTPRVVNSPEEESVAQEERRAHRHAQKQRERLGNFRAHLVVRVEGPPPSRHPLHPNNRPRLEEKEETNKTEMEAESPKTANSEESESQSDSNNSTNIITADSSFGL